MFAAAIALTMLGGISAQGRTDNNKAFMPNYSESFESLTAWGGSYTNVAITNGWYSDLTTDLSAITNLSYVFNAPCGLPSAGPGTNVLHLDTEGATLTNSFLDAGGIGYDMSTGITYADLMIQFVPSDGAPGACTPRDSGIKAAIYVDLATTNLVVYHGVQDGFGSWTTNTNDVVTALINTSSWYRLTISFDATAPWDGSYPNVEMFQVRTNGTPVVSTNAYNDDWKTYYPGSLPPISQTGTWFRSATGPSSVSKKLTAIAFQGTGFIDDLVVTTNMPSSVSSLSSYYMWLVIGSHGRASTNGTPILGPSTNYLKLAATTTSIVYTADDWYRISTLLTNGAAAVPSAQYAKVYTQTIAAASISNNVSFGQLSDVANYNPAYSNIPPSWLSQWPGATEAGLGSIGSLNNGSLTPSQAYLLNINPYVSNAVGFQITGIAVTNTTIDVSLNLSTNSAAYGWSTLIGTLKLYGYTNLTAAPVVVGATTNLSAGAARLEFTDTTSNKFYRAVIE